MMANGRESKRSGPAASNAEIVPIKALSQSKGFYDRKSSKYVTLQEIEELVRGGRNDRGPGQAGTTRI